MSKIYCDSADLNVIKKCIRKFNVHGATTNPSIMRADGVKNYKSHCLKILKITKKGLFQLKYLLTNKMRNIINQAMKNFKLEQKLFVKVPIVNTKELSLTKVIKKLNSNGVKINITTLFLL